MGAVYAVDASLVPVTVVESVGKVVVGGGFMPGKAFVKPVVVDMNPREGKTIRLPTLRLEVDHDSGVVPRYGGGSKIRHDGVTWAVDSYVDIARPGILHTSGIVLMRYDGDGGVLVPLLEPVENVDILIGIIEAHGNNVFVDAYGVGTEIGWEVIEDGEEFVRAVFAVRNGDPFVVEHSFGGGVTKFDVMALRYDGGKLVVKRGFCEDKECKETVFVYDEVLERGESDKSRLGLF